jgi:hypothetical protein
VTRSPRALHVLFAALALAACVPSATAATVAGARLRAPTLIWVRCYASTIACDSAHPTTVARTGSLEVGARGLVARTRALFPARTSRGTVVRGVSGRLVRSTRLVVRVPADAVSGTIRLLSPGSGRSGGLRITVKRPPAPKLTPSPVPGNPAAAAAFGGTGMWIWEMPSSSGGDPVAIGRAAVAAGVRTVYVKSGDGTGNWSQFSAATVAALKAQGLHVCAWQYIYGQQPLAEAQVGITSAQLGAECLVIDAEGEFEGKYAQAQQYIQALRQGVGPSYPVSLASFPYVDYHPSFPFSVFLGPGGAQFNQPQMYWQEIGTTPDSVFAHTWPLNRVYGAAIYPLGQLYNNPPAADIARFRSLASAYGGGGVSWWDWQETSTTGWSAIGAPLTQFTDAQPVTATSWPTLAQGAKGDLVVWAQEHLAGAGQTIAIDGSYGPATAAAVSAFQQAHGLTVSGTLEATTWPTLLAVTPSIPNWGATATPASVKPGARNRRTGPHSALLPTRRYEISAHHGRG